MRLPPPLPPESVYTRCYCEENIYLLCQAFSSRPEILEAWCLYVVFISNESTTVALCSQKAGDPIVWDYHVVLVLKPGKNQEEDIDFDPPESIAYDFDTILSMPCSWNEFFFSTFLEGLPPRYQSKFRVIPGELFVKHFASDRSHMLAKVDQSLPENPNNSPLSEEPRYLSPPPPYPPIRGQSAIESGIEHNLMSHYVDMFYADNPGVYGKVYDYEEVVDFF